MYASVFVWVFAYEYIIELNLTLLEIECWYFETQTTEETSHSQCLFTFSSLGEINVRAKRKQSAVFADNKDNWGKVK